jgi:hypothetical protein
MTNVQFYIAMAMPTFAVLVGILVNLVQISGLRGEIDGVRGEIDGVRGEIGGVRGEIGGVRGEIGGLRAEFNSLRAGQDMLTGKVIELVDRISRLEARQG